MVKEIIQERINVLRNRIAFIEDKRKQLSFTLQAMRSVHFIIDDKLRECFETITEEIKSVESEIKTMEDQICQIENEGINPYLSEFRIENDYSIFHLDSNEVVGHIDISGSLRVLSEYADDSEILFVLDYYKLTLDLI